HLSDGRTVLKARVSAAASDGEANGALIRLLGQTLRVAPRDVTLISGSSSPVKRMLIKGDVHAVVAACAENRGHATSRHHRRSTERPLRPSCAPKSPPR